jgi:hypothetical protein
MLLAFAKLLQPSQHHRESPNNDCIFRPANARSCAFKHIAIKPIKIKVTYCSVQLQAHDLLSILLQLFITNKHQKAPPSQLGSKVRPNLNPGSQL